MRVPIHPIQGPHCTGKTGKMGEDISLSGKTQGIWKCCQIIVNCAKILGKHWEFPDSKDIAIFVAKFKSF